MVRAREAWGRVRSAAFCYLALLVVVVAHGALDAENLTVERYVGADLLMLAVTVAFAWPIRREFASLFRRPRMDAVAWALLFLGPVAFWILNQGLLSAISNLPGLFVNDPMLELSLAGASRGTIFLLLCVSPPLIEEVAFRGVILENIRESFGTWPAAIVVSVLFSVLHLALLSFVPFMGLALVLAALRIRTGSLWPAIAGHALFNLATLLFDVGVTTGTDP